MGGPSPAFPEADPEADPRALLRRYLRFMRESVVAKGASLPAAERRGSRLPSGWTPLELVVHLAAMERRWVVWGFLGEPLEDPWSDEVDGRWHAPPGLSWDAAVAALRSGGARTDAVLVAHGLDELAPPGPRFDGEPASLGSICFHVLQEYARHLGHLDVAVELAGGLMGE